MRASAAPHLFVILIALFAIGEVQAQSPRTMSFQGLLTDNGGAPVADASRTMTFKIYNMESGGSTLWTESKSVATVNGLYNTILGSDTPITGVDFDQDLWLGVTVATDAEMDRTKLTGVPYALGLAMPYEDSVRIQTADLSTDGSERTNEDLTIYANDAMVGLYSNDGGAAGSGIQMGEIAGSSLVDKWSIYRKTSGAESSLRFSYGADPNYAVNPTLVEFDTAAGVTAKSFKFSESKVRHLAINASAFRPDRVNSSIDYVASDIAAFILSGTSTTMFARVDLPDGAILQSIDCYLYDNDDLDLECALEGSVADGSDIVSAISDIGIVDTNGILGYDKLSTPLSHPPIDNTKTSLVVRVNPVSGSWSTAGGDLRMHMVVINYAMAEAW